MDGGTGPGAEMLSPGEAEWPPELRLPPPPPPSLPKHPGPPRPAPPSLCNEPSPTPHLPPPWLQSKKEPSPPRHTEGFDDQQFLGSIMGAAAQPQPQQQPAATAAGAPVPLKRKRGRPPKNRDGAAAVAAPAKPVKQKEEEVVCFICFDGGNLVVCDRRGCPKVYHPACIKRDESFFRSRGKWDCGWHICSSCEKAVQYMCYTCTYSVCKGCIKQGKFFGVRGNKGFCDTCYGTILLIESKDDGAKVSVDFDDKNSWEYLFKLYWLDLKGKHLLTLEELISAKSRWVVPTTAGRREKEVSSDELYDTNNDQDASFGISSRKRRQNNSLGKRGRKRQKDSGITAAKCEISVKGAGSLPNILPCEKMALPGDTKWASSELLEFIGHMRNGDSSYISQFDVQVLLLEYIKQNNLRDPRRKSQIICDARLSNLFRKPRVGHFEMLKLLEMYFLVKETPAANVDSQRAIDPDSAQVGNEGYDGLTAKLGFDKRRKAHKKIQRELTANPEDYAAIDMHNINLIYLRRSLMEDLIDDDAAAFSDKIAGAFVRIRISGLGQKEDMYRLVKVLGTHKVAERYSVGKKTTDYALEISNLDKKEVITMDTISNQDFTEEECKRLRQSMKFGLITQLKVGDIYEKAKIFHSLRVKDWLENEKQRLSHLRDRASETGRRKELRECVENLQLLNTPEEIARRINEVPEVHVDPHMAADYECAEEQDYKKAVDWTINRNGPDLLFPGRKGTKLNAVENHTQKCLNASGHTSSPPTEGTSHRSGAGSDINLNNTAVEGASLSPPGVVSSDAEPEKVWHYKDPSGNVHGPFTLLQLSKWASYFPRDLRIWLTFESEENSLLLTEVLPKQQKDFVQPTAVTTSGQDRSNSNFVANNSSSPIGYNVVYPSELSSQSAESSDPTKEGPKLLGGTLPSKPLKDAHSLHGQVQHQVNYSCTIPSSAGSYGPPGSHDEGVPRKQVGEWNSCQDNGGMWSPTILPMNHSRKCNAEQHPDGCTMKDQLQNDSKSNLLAGSVGNLNSRMDSGSQKASVLTPQQSARDPAPSRSTTSLSEFKTVCHQEDSCWSSGKNAGPHDDLQLSIALVKPESCLLANPVEDRDSSSASGVPSKSGAPACLPQPVLSISNSNSRKTEVTMNQHKTCHPDASNEPFDQHPELKSEPVFSSKTEDLECEYPSPTPKLERKETSMNPLEDSATKTCVHSSISLVSETSGTPVGKIDSLQPLEETSCLEERHLRDRDTQAEQLNEESTALKRNSIVVNPVSDAEGIAVSDVFESLTEQDCEKYSIHGAVPLEKFVPASAEEEQPQCSSPIALSPWGEPSYYQGEAVDSALWGVQDDPSNDMWSMPSPTPALQPSSGLGADGKDASCIIQELIATRGNSAFVETLPTQGKKKMEQGNPTASTGSGVPEQVKSKPSAASGPSLDGSTKASGWQTSDSSLEGSAKPSGWKPPSLSLEGITEDSGWQPSGSSVEGGVKGSGCQPSSSTEGSTKGSGWQQSSSSPNGSRKASGWQRSSSSPDGSRKASGWQRSSTSPEGSRKASGWQQSGSSTQGIEKVSGRQLTSSSLEGSRKTSGWHSSVRESSKVNSTSGANENRKLSSNHQATTPTAKHSSEAPKRHGNSDKNITAGWGEALGSNKGCYPSAGRGSQGNHSRRPDHRHDHGTGGSSRSSRGQSQRGVCKFYEHGHCRKGSTCQYLHR